MFASKTIARHLARGALGLGLLWASASWAADRPWLLLISMPLALLALRGCPLCWTLGLMQTVLARVQGRSTDGACVAGQCAVARDEAQQMPRA